MHLAGLAVCVSLLAAQPSPPPEEKAPPFDLTSLREQVAQRLLELPSGPHSPLDQPAVAVIDHLWKSNGGAVIPRTYANADARRLADQLAQQIEYDAVTDTILWPMYGFADPNSLRFTPETQWTALAPYFQDDRFDRDTVQKLQENYIAAASKRPAVYDPLTAPDGFSMPPEALLGLLGYAGTLFVYSPANCFDAAFECYTIGLYDDARVFLSHGIAQAQDARYYYLRGTIEMLTGHSADAKITALGFIAASGAPRKGAGPSYVYERINGPAAIEFRDLAAQMAAILTRRDQLNRQKPAAEPPPPAGNLE
jgi:hypothetical protein